MNRYLCFVCLILLGCASQPRGSGRSVSEGKVNDGALKNGRKFPWKGDNYRYFSPFSYSVLNRAWVHEKVLKTTLDTYAALEKQMPEKKWLLMECSEKHGGRMRPHRTHQNGTSIDFGTPLLKNGEPHHIDRMYGVFHYVMGFREDGTAKGNKKVQIDFERMAQHLLLLEKTARKNGLYIKKVIFKVDLKDDLFKGTYGRKLKRSGIYFARKLSKAVDNVHDDHYHVDFGFL